MNNRAAPVGNENNRVLEDADEYKNKSFILKKVLVHNFFPQLFIYWLVDQKNIYVTSFEVLVFIVSYTYFSLVIASKEVIADYIKLVSKTIRHS